MAEVREREARKERPPRRGSHPRRPEHEGERAASAQERSEEQVQEPPDESAQESSERSAQERSEEQGQQPPEESAEEPAERRSLLQRFGLAAVGWGLVLLVLAGYFVWLASEMGTAAVTGVGPLVAVFAATAFAVLVAGGAFVLARRNREH